MNTAPPALSGGPRLGIDLGGTTITAVVTGRGAEVRAVAEGETGDHSDPGVVLDRVSGLARSALAQAGVRADELVAAGVGLPGEVEVEAGAFRSSPIMPTWHNVPVASGLKERLGVMFGVENDANATLLGEWAFGAGQGADPVLLLTLGTGIGGAVLVNGKIVRGFRGSAGEVGHLSVDPEGPVCWCGGRGCLGLLGSATALVRRYREAADLGDAAAVDGRTVARALAQGDPAAVAAVDELAHWLARGVADAACVLGPERVVLFGGILAGVGDALLAGIRARLAVRPYPAVISSLQVVSATLGPRAGAIGASLLSPVGAPA